MILPPDEQARDARRSFPLGGDPQLWLVVSPRGVTGAFGLTCALGLTRLPATIDSALNRPEWVDVVAKARGMLHVSIDLLCSFPVLRQHCGCRLGFERIEGPGPARARFAVRLCSGHPWERAEAIGEEELHPERGMIVLGMLVEKP